MKRIAGLFLQGKKLFPGFESVFAAADVQRLEPLSPQALLAVALQQARHIVLDLLEHISRGGRLDHLDADTQEKWREVEPRAGPFYLHGGILFKEGIRIGELLSRAESLILSQRYFRQVSSVKAPRVLLRTQFWDWICGPEFEKYGPADFLANKDEKSKGEKPSIEGKEVPGTDGLKVKLEASNILLGETKLMTIRSFTSSLSARRKERA